MSICSISGCLRLALFAVLVAACVSDKPKKFRKKAMQFQCPTEKGLYANPHNCGRFYICKGFVPYDTPCPTSLYFNDAKKTCVHKSKDLQCGPIAVTTSAPRTPDPNVALSCIRSACNLPDCFCSKNGTKSPGNFHSREIPQMIILAFSGALNATNAERFKYVLNETRMNPNGCPIKATFFVPHEYTSYYYVQQLYGQGHEIAMQTITNRLSEDYWPKASTEDWIEEVIGMQDILRNFANVSQTNLLGMRAPFLKPGGNNMMSMIYDFGLKYDSSLAAPLSRVPLWPYTLDFRMPHKCMSENCPSKSFPGIWEIPLNTMRNAAGTKSCVFVDQCDFSDHIDTIFRFFNYNFERHYFTNKAPLLLNFNVNWVTDHSKATALVVFIHQILKLTDDVWFVTMQQALDWMRRPVSENSVRGFDAWKCPRTRLPGCSIPRTCSLKFKDAKFEDTREMQLCGKCPSRYPWVNNIRGTGEGK